MVGSGPQDPRREQSIGGRPQKTMVCPTEQQSRNQNGAGDKMAGATKERTSARKPTLQAGGPRHENSSRQEKTLTGFMFGTYRPMETNAAIINFSGGLSGVSHI